MKSITNRLEKLESCLKPIVKEEEVTAEEWIEFLEYKRDDTRSPILSAFYSELITSLGGRHLLETYSNDRAVKSIFEYIMELERCTDRKVHTFAYDQIKEGVSKFIDVINNNYPLGYYHDCAECGAGMPITPGEGGVTADVKPAVKYFDTCPFCGGKTGYAAYYYNQKKRAESMNTITKRIEKIEAVLLKENGTDNIERMTPEERYRRIAELIYKGLSDTDQEVMAMTDEEFITMYLSMNPDDRHIKYDRPIYEQLTGGQKL